MEQLQGRLCSSPGRRAQAPDMAVVEGEAEDRQIVRLRPLADRDLRGRDLMGRPESSH